MKSLILPLLIAICAFVAEKDPIENKILKEGKLLFRLEKASWYGTDEFLAYFPNLRDSTGGYLSYETENHQINTIFFSVLNPDRILIRYQFDSLPKQKPIYADILNHSATDIEKALIKIRQDALMRINSNSDKFFSFYQNTSLNTIPIITGSEKKVYVISASTQAGQVMIGNDYILRYDNNNTLISKDKIHKSLIPLPAKNIDNEKNPAVATMHSHIISDYIDPTDICTLLLYRDFVEWKTHYVISKNYVSIFDLEKETLVIMTKKAWENISKVTSENKK